MYWENINTYTDFIIILLVSFLLCCLHHSIKWRLWADSRARGCVFLRLFFRLARVSNISKLSPNWHGRGREMKTEEERHKEVKAKMLHLFCVNLQVFSMCRAGAAVSIHLLQRSTSLSHTLNICNRCLFRFSLNCLKVSLKAVNWKWNLNLEKDHQSDFSFRSGMTVFF